MLHVTLSAWSASLVSCQHRSSNGQWTAFGIYDTEDDAKDTIRLHHEYEFKFSHRSGRSAPFSSTYTCESHMDADGTPCDARMKLVPRLGSWHVLVNTIPHALQCKPSARLRPGVPPSVLTVTFRFLSKLRASFRLIRIPASTQRQGLSVVTGRPTEYQASWLRVLSVTFFSLAWLGGLAFC
jgi:hypothetical protein